MKLRNISEGELKLMFLRLAIDVLEKPHEYGPDGNGVNEFFRGEDLRRSLSVPDSAVEEKSIVDWELYHKIRSTKTAFIKELPSDYGKSILTDIPEDKKYHLTLFASIMSELVEEKIITPSQKWDAERYVIDQMLEKEKKKK